MIHPTAIVDPAAQIPESCTIGPRVLIEGPVKLGENCEVQANAVILGNVSLGSNNTIGYSAVIGGLPQDLSFDPKCLSYVRIGDGNTIRELCTVHRGTMPESTTEIGSNNFLMVGVHVAHNAKIGDRCILANNVLLAGHVQLADRVVIGGGSVFHQHLRIGSYAMVRGLCAFGKDIPPYTLGVAPNCVNGLNAVGLKRGGFNLEARKELKEAFRLLYSTGLNLTQACEAAAAREWSPAAQYFWEFAGSAKKRGICRLLESWRGHSESGSE